MTGIATLRYSITCRARVDVSCQKELKLIASGVCLGSKADSEGCPQLRPLLGVKQTSISGDWMSAFRSEADVGDEIAGSLHLTPSRLRWQSALVLFDRSHQGVLDRYLNAEA